MQINYMTLLMNWINFGIIILIIIGIYKGIKEFKSRLIVFKYKSHLVIFRREDEIETYEEFLQV